MQYTERSEKVMIWLCSIAGIIAVMAVIHYGKAWMIAHDEAVNRAAEAYERCVKAEYNTTPMEWYWSHNETMPTCDPKPYADGN